MPAIALYPFRFFDLRTRRWILARYVAQLPVIAEHYPAFQLVGAPEIRDSPDRLARAHRGQPWRQADIKEAAAGDRRENRPKDWEGG